MLRIIAGQYRSRSLLAPPDETVSRPYTHRVRESVFDLLRGWFEDARVLDLFAGTGSVGLEAVSRGAAAVVMIERDRSIFRLLERNIESLDCHDRVTAVHADALSGAALLRAPEPVDVVFVDPPYGMMREEAGRVRLLTHVARLSSVMAGRSFLVLRSPFGPHESDLAIEGFDGPESHKYGKNMWVLLYAPANGVANDAPTDGESDA